MLIFSGNATQITLSDLHNAIVAVCPIIGIEGDIKDRITWAIDFDPSATDAQKAAAQTVLTSFNPDAVLTVSPRQARLALVQSGLYDQVNTTINASDETTQIWWEYASVIERQNPILLMIATQLNLDSAHIDSLFKLAATL